jgi:hypothetical protein
MDEMQYLRYFSLTTFRSGMVSQATFYKLGSVLPTTNPNAYVQEKHCANKIIRQVGAGTDHIVATDPDGRVWSIYLSNFETVTPLEVIMK